MNDSIRFLINHMDSEIMKKMAEKVILQDKNGDYYLLAISSGTNGALGSLYSPSTIVKGGTSDAECDLIYTQGSSYIYVELNSMFVSQKLEGRGLAKLILAQMMEHAAKKTPVKFHLTQDPFLIKVYDKEKGLNFREDFTQDYFLKNKQKQDRLYNSLGFEIDAVNGRFIKRSTPEFPQGQILCPPHIEHGIKIATLENASKNLAAKRG